MFVNIYIVRGKKGIKVKELVIHKDNGEGCLALTINNEKLSDPSSCYLGLLNQLFLTVILWY